MDYPYLVDELKINIKKVNELKRSLDNLLLHINKNAVVKKGLFITQPSQTNINPPNDSKISQQNGGRTNKYRYFKKKRTKKNKRKV